MMIKTFVDSTDAVINDFVKGKKVIDIKIVAEAGSFLVLVMYDEAVKDV